MGNKEREKYMTSLLIYRALVAYRLPEEWNKPLYHFDKEIKELDTREKIAQIFKEDRLSKTFCQFWAKGFQGIAWCNGSSWISYAWMSLPETYGPPHLPQDIQRLPVYWIFYCRTKEEYRGRGFFRASICLFCDRARERDPKAEVYIDTEPDNLPSRKAIQAVGFVPAGMISTWSLRFPKLGSFIIKWQWDRRAHHPEVA